MKTVKSLVVSQKGFALLHILPAFVLVAAIAFVGGSVYQAQEKKQEAARIAQAEAEQKKQQELNVKQTDSQTQKEVEVPPIKEEQTEVSSPAPKTVPTTTSTEKQKTTPTYTVVTIPTTSASVGAENVVLTAKLPSVYSGTCKALVKLPDGSSAQWFDAQFGPSDTCSITVSRSKLTAGTEWKFYMYFKGSDGLTKGEGGGNLFSL